MTSLVDNIYFTDDFADDAADLLAKIGNTDFTESQGFSGDNTKRGECKYADETAKAIANSFDLKLKSYFAIKTESRYFVAPHHDQDGSLEKVAVLYLSGTGRLIFPGEGRELETKAGRLVIFSPELVHYAPTQKDGRYFVRLDFHK
tara:strand:- start:2741 stop:3178 length:438 start_codon:yes stop_codon:yes gene_type:complete